ncbi:MAG: tail fiber domain-containing protein [Bacteroidota bacterium]
MSQPEQNTTPKLPWVTPEIIVIDVNLINQQAMDQEAELLNYLATDENAFRLFSGSSDYRLKEDLSEFNALDLVKKVSVYDFAWKNGNGREIGVMAHELQQAFPYLVSGQKDEVDVNGQPIIQRVNYAKLVPVLLKAIQEQQQQLNELQEQLQIMLKQQEPQS